MRGKIIRITSGLCGLAMITAAMTITAPASSAAVTIPSSVENIVHDSNQQTVIDVFNGINAFRASKGLAPLTFSVPISVVSQKWSETMAAEDHYRHNPDFVTGTPEGHLKTSEIIAARWDRSGQSLVNQWIDSPEHNNIMSTPDMTTMGIGVTYTDGTPDLVALRYPTYATANLFKYNGTPAQTYASPADYFAGNPALPTELSAVTPAGPSFTDTTYTIPDVKGVKYTVNGVDAQPGTYNATEPIYNFRAIFLYGHYSPTADTITQWNATYTLPETKIVTVTEPTFDTQASTVRLHHAFGIEYLINGVVHPSGTYYLNTVVDIRVRATSGYTLDPSRPTSWSHDFTPVYTPPSLITVAPAAPIFNVIDGTYTIPSTDGVVYKANGEVVPPGVYPGAGAINITVSPAEGYVLSEGAKVEWTGDLTPVAEQTPTPPMPGTTPPVPTPGTETAPAPSPDAPSTVVAVAPTVDLKAGTYIIPSVTGVYYKVNGVERAAGVYSATGEVRMTAHALNGYILSGTAAWTFNMMNTPAVRAGDMLAIDAKGIVWNYGNNSMKTRKMVFASGYLPAKKLFATDWNSDGVTDIVTQWKAGNMTVSFGSNDGTFSKIKVIGSGWGSYDVSIGKYRKADKYPSIIAKDTAGNLWNYSNLYGTGINSRTAKGSGWKALQINLIDWDKDGNMDIIAKNSLGKVILYRTDGTGKFKSEARNVIGTGWNTFQMRTITDYAGLGTHGVLAKDSSGRLYYYGTGNGKWFAKTYKGAGWTLMNIAG